MNLNHEERVRVDVLVGIAEEFTKDVADDDARHALTHLTSAIRELTRDKTRPNKTILYAKLQEHASHNVSIVAYALPEDRPDPQNIALECEGCGVVIMDTDVYDLAPVEDQPA